MVITSIITIIITNHYNHSHNHNSANHDHNHSNINNNDNRNETLRSCPTCSSHLRRQIRKVSNYKMLRPKKKKTTTYELKYKTE